MKKILVLAFLIGATTLGAFAQEPVKTVDTKPVDVKEIKKHHGMNFEKRLNLTEEQKIKAKQIREEGREKIKPLVEQIRAKRQEAEVVKLSRISVQAQKEKLAVIDKEIKQLEKQLKKARKENFKKFKSILTKEQKNLLHQIKKEGKGMYKPVHSGK